MKVTIFCTMICVVLLYFVLFLPCIVSAYFYCDYEEKLCFYLISFVGIKLICGRIFLCGGKFVVENETDLFGISKQKIHKRFLLVGYLLLRFVDIVSVDVKFSCGNSKNPAKSAILCGIFHSFAGALFSFFKTKSPNATFKKRVYFLPYKNSCNLLVRTHVSLCLFDVLKSFVYARIEAGKSVQTNNED